MRGLAQLGCVRYLVAVRTEVEVAAEAQLELVAVVGDAPPDLQRFDRKRQLCGLASLHPDRPLGAARLLQSGAGLLLDDHHARAASGECLGGGDAADPGADDDHIGCLSFVHSLYGITNMRVQGIRTDPLAGPVQGGLPVRIAGPTDPPELPGP